MLSHSKVSDAEEDPITRWFPGYEHWTNAVDVKVLDIHIQSVQPSFHDLSFPRTAVSILKLLWKKALISPSLRLGKYFRSDRKYDGTERRVKVIQNSIFLTLQKKKNIEILVTPESSNYLYWNSKKLLKLSQWMGRFSRDIKPYIWRTGYL